MRRDSDSRTLQLSPESVGRAGCDGHKRRKGSKVHLAVDTLGQLLAVLVTPANEHDRASRRAGPTDPGGDRRLRAFVGDVIGLHFVPFAMLLAHRFVTFIVQSA